VNKIEDWKYSFYNEYHGNVKEPIGSTRLAGQTINFNKDNLSSILLIWHLMK